MNRNRIVLIVADVVIILVAVSALLFYTQPLTPQASGRFVPQNAVSSATSIQVLQYHMYNDSHSGYTYENQSLMYVLGIVKDNYSQPLAYSYLTTVMMGSNGKPISYGSVTGGALLRVIEPGQTSPFIGYMNFPAFSYEHIASVQIISGAANHAWPKVPAYLVNSQPYTSLTTTVNNKGAGANSTYSVGGLISNTGSSVAQNVEIVVSLLDSSGNIVGAGYTFVPQSMNPGSSTAFSVSAITFSQNVASVNVQAEGFTSS